MSSETKTGKWVVIFLWGRLLGLGDRLVETRERVVCFGLLRLSTAKKIESVLLLLGSYWWAAKVSEP